jgi:hypothetical protein
VPQPGRDRFCVEPRRAAAGKFNQSCYSTHLLYHRQNSSPAPSLCTIALLGVRLYRIPSAGLKKLMARRHDITELCSLTLR